MADSARPSAAAASVEQPYGWVVVLASFAMLAIGSGAVYISVVALRPIAESLDVPRALPALCYGLAMLGMGFGGVLIGRVADRIGMGLPALMGALVLPFGSWLASTADEPWRLFIAHGLFIGLLGNGALFAPLVANVTRWFDRRRGTAVAMVTSGQHLAGAIWPPIHSYVTLNYGWRQAFLVYAVVTLVLLVPLALLLRPLPPVPAAGGHGVRRLGSGLVLGLRPGLVQVMLCAAIVGCCVAMAMPIVHLVAHASDLGHDPARAAEMLAVLLFCGFLTRLAFGPLADRIGGLRAVLLGASAQAASLGLFLVVEGLVPLYLAAAAFGFSFGGIVPCYALVVRDLFPAREAGTRIGAVFLFGTIGMALGGWLGGLIFDLTRSYRIAFLVGIAFNLGNVALLAALNLRRVRDAQAAA